MSKVEKKISVLNAIHERRSVRDYSPQRLDHATIRKLLDAAVWAPTAVHEEPWAFVIVQDMATLKSLSDRAKSDFRCAGAARASQIKRVICSGFSTSPTSIFSITPAR